MTYLDSLDYISSLEPRGWRLGLDRMTAFVHKLGLENDLKPPRRKYIHIAGTNGKGSTTHFVQNLLLAHGESCGAFLSPFVYDPRERIALNGQMVSKDEFRDLVVRIKPIAESLEATDFGGVTEFEFKTAMGFQFWADKNACYVALETGLGGRLDATNVVTPVASIITSISLDHQSILGFTEREIATEKAGIIKSGSPTVVGEVSDEAFEAIRKKANERGSDLFRYGHEFGIDTSGTYFSPLRKIQDFPVPTLKGQIQRQNLAIALTGIEATGLQLSEDEIRNVAEKTAVPGRFEIRKWEDCTIILDGAHNVASAKNLTQSFQEAYGSNAKAILITNMVQGHDPMGYYRELKPIVEVAYVPPIEFHRARQPSEIQSFLNELSINSISGGKLNAIVLKAIEESKRTHLPVLVTGSFYLVGEVGNYLESIHKNEYKK